MKFSILVLSLFLIYVNDAQSQSFSINTTGAIADSSAILDVKSTSKGVLIPRLTSAQKITISNPALGLLVFQTDGDKGFYYYDGTKWLLLMSTKLNDNNTSLIYTTRGF